MILSFIIMLDTLNTHLVVNKKTENYAMQTMIRF